MKRSFFVLATAFILFLQTSCKKESSTDAALAGATKEAVEINHVVTSAQSGTTFTTVPFVGIANVSACLGFNIRFSGNVEMKTHQIVKDGDIQTYTRQWSVKGLSATSWSTLHPTNGTSTVNGEVTNYIIKAGAEMFAVQDPAIISSIGTPGQPLLTSIFIHQGTLVLENVNDPSDKIVIRHQIVKTPNTTSAMDMPRMGWYINGRQCGL